jgi:hypothetical protein
MQMQPINIIDGVWRQGVEPKVTNLTGTAFMEEAGAHKFRVTAQDAQGEETEFTGTVTALFLRSDNTTVALDGTIEGGAATVTLVSDCYHVPGRFSIAVYVSDGTDSACVYAAVGNVYRTSSDTVIDSGATIPTLAQLEAAYAACVQATEDAEAVTGRVDAIEPVNLAAGLTYVNSKSIRSDTGATRTSSYYRYVDYIDVSGCAKIVYPRIVSTETGNSLTYMGAAFYNASKTFVAGALPALHGNFTHTEATVLDVPEGAVYFRATWLPVSNNFDEGEFWLYDATEFANTMAEKVIDVDACNFAVQNTIAPYDGMTARTAHAVGRLVVVDGVLYKVTSAIVAGDTISDHATRTTIEAQLAALEARIAALEA